MMYVMRALDADEIDVRDVDEVAEKVLMMFDVDIDGVWWRGVYVVYMSFNFI